MNERYNFFSITLPVHTNVNVSEHGDVFVNKEKNDAYNDDRSEKICTAHVISAGYWGILTKLFGARSIHLKYFTHFTVVRISTFSSL